MILSYVHILFLLPTRWGGCCCGNNGVTFDMPYDIPRCMQECLVNTDDRFLWDAHTQIHLIFPVNLNFFELFPQHKHRHRAKQVLQKGLLLCKSCLCHSLGCVCLRVNMCAKGSVELSASVILRVNQVVGRGGTVQADIGLICLGKRVACCACGFRQAWGKEGSTGDIIERTTVRLGTTHPALLPTLQGDSSPVWRRVAANTTNFLYSLISPTLHKSLYIIISHILTMSFSPCVFHMGCIRFILIVLDTAYAHSE